MRRIHSDRSWPKSMATYGLYLKSDVNDIDRDEYQRTLVNGYVRSSRDRPDIKARQKAEYYVWARRKGFSSPLRDPLTGRVADNREEGKVIYYALAKYWFRKCREIRNSTGKRLP